MSILLLLLTDDFLNLFHAHLYMQEEWVICRILHKAGDQYSKLMMVKNPYYLPMAMDPSSFCFQQDPTAPPLPNPSGCAGPLGLPFHHGHPSMQPPPLPPSNHGKVVFPGSAAACCMQQEGSNSVVPMPQPFPPFTPIVAGKPAPAPPPQVGVNAGPQEPAPPTWLEAYLQHSGGILYEMGPAAAPRGA